LRLKAKLGISIIAWFVLGLPLLLLSLVVSGFFFIPIMALMLAVGSYTLSLRCPNCNARAIYNPIRVLGLQIWCYTPWIPSECSRCGHKLD
jgi:hypothetical protein